MTEGTEGAQKKELEQPEVEEETTLWKQLRDFLLDHVETGFGLVVATAALTGAIRSSSSLVAWSIAGIIFIATVGQGVFRHKHSTKISSLQRQIRKHQDNERDWKSEEEAYQERIRTIQANNVDVLRSWLSEVSVALNLDHQQRLSLFVIGADDAVAYLVARFSHSPAFCVVPRKEYTVDGALGEAWRVGHHYGDLLPNPLGSKRQVKRYVKAAVDAYHVQASRVVSSEMKPRLYASWRLDATNGQHSRAVLVFESQDESTFPIDDLESMIASDDSKAIRRLAELAREYEVHSRRNASVDIEGSL